MVEVAVTDRIPEATRPAAPAPFQRGSDGRSHYLVWAVLAALVLSRTALSLLVISRPGLQYDETMFVDAATLRIPGMYLLHPFFGVPMNVYPYIGALKSWIYTPIFSLFGTSPASVRIPVVLIVSASLPLLYVAVRDLVNRSVALLVFVLLAFDQSLLWYTRNDVGPSALEFGIKCAAMFCFARLLKLRTGRWLGALLILLAAGVFNKLNFIWVVNAAAVVSLLVVVLNQGTFVAYRRLTLVWFGGIALIIATFAAYYFRFQIGELGAGVGSFGPRWSQFAHGTAAILSGTSFYGYALGPIGLHVVVAVLMLAFFAVGAIVSVARWRAVRWRAGSPAVVAGVALGTLLIAGQCLFTYKAREGWHYIAIYPFVAIVAAYGAYASATALLRKPVRIAAALVLVGLAAVAYDGSLYVTYSGALAREPRFSAWSPSVYALDRYLSRVPGTVFAADWGIANPLFTLSPSARYRDECHLLDQPGRLAVPQLQAALARTPGPKLFVTHAPHKLVFPVTLPNLLKAEGSRLKLVKTVNGLDGQPVFKIYRLI